MAPANESRIGQKQYWEEIFLPFRLTFLFFSPPVSIYISVYLPPPFFISIYQFAFRLTDMTVLYAAFDMPTFGHQQPSYSLLLSYSCSMHFHLCASIHHLSISIYLLAFRRTDMTKSYMQVFISRRLDITGLAILSSYRTVSIHFLLFAFIRHLFSSTYLFAFRPTDMTKTYMQFLIYQRLNKTFSNIKAISHALSDSNANYTDSPCPVLKTLYRVPKDVQYGRSKPRFHFLSNFEQTEISAPSLSQSYPKRP